MNGIAIKHAVDDSVYVTPQCNIVEVSSEGILCFSQGGLNNVIHDGFGGSDYIGGWDE